MPEKLDALDRRILHELCRNGRLSNSQLAERVGLSPSPCWQCAKRLEDEGCDAVLETPAFAA
jgi:Lrp/AsnC family transcriptional regulator, leucine-responsive regulatory protein